MFEDHVPEPARAFFLPDQIEALIALGRLNRAERLLAAFEEAARRLDRSWALMLADRCRALLLAARGDLEGASAAAHDALARGAELEVQETDCIHLGGGHTTDAAAHDAGDVSGWSASGGALTITGVKIIGGLEIATLSIPLPAGEFGHSNGMTLTVTSAVVPIIPVGVPLLFPSQNELAP